MPLLRRRDSGRAERLRGGQGGSQQYGHCAAVPPVCCRLKADPGQCGNSATEPAYAVRMGEDAAKMLTWRLGFAERSLTGYRATPKGLEVRAA